jgi:dTDP-4-amino-4,6-dideoxygalactose transaminase
MIEYENLHKANASFFDEFRADFSDSLENGWFILGNKVARFEQAFAAYCGSRHCVGVASGLDALLLSLHAFAFADGSEVIVPSNTYIATVLAVLHNRLKPVLVEPDLRTYNLDPGLIEERITPKTKAIIAVHLYGKPCAMDAIASLAEKYGVKLIEDCAQSHGASYKGRMTGTFGDYGAFSFYPTKNLGALGDGGALVTDSDETAEKIRKLRNYGSTVKYRNDEVGFNSRLDEIQAGFLSIKLKSLDAIIAHKRRLAALYLANLKDDFVKPVVDPDCFDVYHIFTIRHPQRDKIREYLLKHEIKTEIHYPIPPHRQKCLQGLVDAGPYPIAEEIHATTLSLPISFFHTEEDVMRVVECLNRY